MWQLAKKVVKPIRPIKLSKLGSAIAQQSQVPHGFGAMESAFAKNAISDAFPSLSDIHKKNCAALGQENHNARERTKRHEQLFAFVCPSMHAPRK